MTILVTASLEVVPRWMLEKTGEFVTYLLERT